MTVSWGGYVSWKAVFPIEKQNEAKMPDLRLLWDDDDAQQLDPFGDSVGSDCIFSFDDENCYSPLDGEPIWRTPSQSSQPVAEEKRVEQTPQEVIKDLKKTIVCQTDDLSNKKLNALLIDIGKNLDHYIEQRENPCLWERIFYNEEVLTQRLHRVALPLRRKIDKIFLLLNTPRQPDQLSPCEELAAAVNCAIEWNCTLTQKYDVGLGSLHQLLEAWKTQAQELAVS